MAVNKLALNREKSSSSCFAPVRWNQSDINRVQNSYGFLLTDFTKLIGITIDSMLVWTYHVGNLCIKLTKVCCALKSLGKSCNYDALRVFYYSHIRSLLEYGIIHWCLCLENLTDLWNAEKRSKDFI